MLLGIFNYDRARKRDVSLEIDLEALGLVPELRWQEFIGVRDLFRRDAAWVTDQEARSTAARPHVLCPTHTYFLW